jgi:hypothetical protein
MANRHNHYEAAFADLLRQQRVPYVAVNESHRSWDQAGSLKSADFLVSPPGAQSWIIDIKGRRFPSGTRQKQYWRNWTTRDDVRSLAEWARHLGQGIEPLLVFAFDVVGDRSPVPPAELHFFGERRYAFIAVRLADYLVGAKGLSSRWDTISMPVATFRKQGVSWHQLLEQQRESALTPAW